MRYYIVCVYIYINATRIFSKEKAEKGGRSRKKGISVFEQIKNLFIYLFSSRLVLEFAEYVILSNIIEKSFD